MKKIFAGQIDGSYAIELFREAFALVFERKEDWIVPKMYKRKYEITELIAELKYKGNDMTFN